MANIVLPQDVFTKYKLESIGDESDTAYLANKCRSLHSLIASPAFIYCIPSEYQKHAKQSLNALHYFDGQMEENLSNKNAAPIIKQLAKNN